MPWPSPSQPRDVAMVASQVVSRLATLLVVQTNESASVLSALAVTSILALMDRKNILKAGRRRYCSLLFVLNLRVDPENMRFLGTVMHAKLAE